MIKANNIDRFLIISTLALVAIGSIMVYSTSYVVAMKKFGNEYFFAKRHVIFALLGLVFFVISSRIPYRLYRNAAYPLLIVSIVLLAAIFIPGIGHEVGGAKRWLKLGGLTFQPSEIGKLAVIIFLAYRLEAKKDMIKTFSKGFLPNIIIPSVVILLILVETDFGTAVTLAMLVCIMNVIGGVRVRYLMLLFLLALPFLYFVVSTHRYMMERLLIFINPWKDPGGSGFQIIQSFLAFGSGGISGVGPGDGRQKLLYLPEAHTDFIFSIIGEEFGLIGVTAIIALFIMFLVSGTAAAIRAKDLFGTYLALGITFMLSLQALINMAVVMGILPPKGLPLPFISYGGSAIMVSLFSVGIIWNICIEGNEP